MEQIKSILSKINTLGSNTYNWSAIEKDLALQYTRNLYETIMAQPITDAGTPNEEIETTVAPSFATTDSINENTATINDETHHYPVELEEMHIAVEEEVHNEEEIEEETNFEEDELVDEAYEDEVYTDDMLEFEVKDIMPEELIIEDEETQEEEMEEEAAINDEEEIEEEEESGAITLSNPDIPHIIEIETPAIPQVSEFKLWHKDIRTYIGINDKYNFISELFNNNAEAYEEVLNEINKCANKDAVLAFLDQAGITTLYQWDTEGFSAQVFYNVLNQFFASK